MTTHSQHLNQFDGRLLWAIGFSICLHVLVAFILPNFEFDLPKPAETLIVELMQPKKAEPTPIEAPMPEQLPTPTPPKPPEKLTPVTPPKQQPVTPTKTVTEPSPVSSPSNQSPQPEVIAVSPKTDSTPAFTAPAQPAAPAQVSAPPPPAEPPRPAGPSQQDLDAARNLYGGLLTKEISKHKQYPKVAQMRGWQGEVLLELQLDGNGNMLSAKVKNSSSYEALDKQALEMVKKASPFPAPPDALKGRSFVILVPIPFRLDE